MELWEAIKTRRSVRKLEGRVDLEDLLKPLEASIWAPSAHNAQPWRIVAILGLKVKRSLAEAMAKAWVKDLVADGIEEEVALEASRRSIDLISRSPALVLFCLTMEGMKEHPDERRRKAEYLMAVQSVSASIQNLLLALHEEGLASCWLCAPLFCQDEVREVLGIPSDVDPQALIIVGKPSEEPQPPPRRPLEEVVFLDRWSQSIKVSKRLSEGVRA